MYGEREYRLSLESKTFDEAEASCAAQSGQLARCAKPRRVVFVLGMAGKAWEDSN